MTTANARMWTRSRRVVWIALAILAVAVAMTVLSTAPAYLRLSRQHRALEVFRNASCAITMSRGATPQTDYDRVYAALFRVSSPSIDSLCCGEFDHRHVPFLKDVGDIKRLSACVDTIDDDACSTIGQLTTLECLELNGSKVTDRGLANFGALKNLKTLRLRDTLVTDASIQLLSSFRSLEVLDLDGTQVTQSGLQSLKEALGSCRIVYGMPGQFADEPPMLQ